MVDLVFNVTKLGKYAQRQTCKEHGNEVWGYVYRYVESGLRSHRFCDDSSRSGKSSFIQV